MKYFYWMMIEHFIFFRENFNINVTTLISFWWKKTTIFLNWFGSIETLLIGFFQKYFVFNWPISGDYLFNWSILLSNRRSTEFPVFIKILIRIYYIVSFFLNFSFIKQYISHSAFHSFNLFLLSIYSRMV